MVQTTTRFPWALLLAFYAVFSISPLLIIALSISGFFYKGESTGYIEAEIAEFIGNNAAKVITGTIESVSKSHGQWLDRHGAQRDDTFPRRLGSILCSCSHP